MICWTWMITKNAYFWMHFVFWKNLIYRLKLISLLQINGEKDIANVKIVTTKRLKAAAGHGLINELYYFSRVNLLSLWDCITMKIEKRTQMTQSLKSCIHYVKWLPLHKEIVMTHLDCEKITNVFWSRSKVFNSLIYFNVQVKSVVAEVLASSLE